jgi:hypothetical protein
MTAKVCPKGLSLHGTVARQRRPYFKRRLNHGEGRLYPLTVMSTDSIAAWPDLRKGRGMGCAEPFASD